MDHETDELRDDFNSKLSQTISQVSDTITARTKERDMITRKLTEHIDGQHLKNTQHDALHTQITWKINELSKNVQTAINEMTTTRAALYNDINEFKKSVDKQQQQTVNDMYAHDNRNFKFILVVIDCFSKFVWVKPLKTKTGEDVTRAFQDILNNKSSGRYP